MRINSVVEMKFQTHSQHDIRWGKSSERKTINLYEYFAFYMSVNSSL
jgi:hypothetical protein